MLSLWPELNYIYTSAVKPYDVNNILVNSAYYVCSVAFPVEINLPVYVAFIKPDSELTVEVNYKAYLKYI